MTGNFQFIDCSSVKGNEESQEIWPCVEALPPFLKEDAKGQKFLVLRLKKKPPSTNNEIKVNQVKQEVLEIKEEVIYDDAESMNSLPKELNSENNLTIKAELNSDTSTCSASPLNETLFIDTTRSTRPTEVNSLQMCYSHQHIIEVKQNATLPFIFSRSNMSNLEKAIERVATGADTSTHQVLLKQSKIKFIPPVREKIVPRPKLLPTCKYKTCFNLKFPNELSFIKHLWIFHSIFMCEICKRRFPMKFSLLDQKNRVRTMHRRYKCTVCRNSFSNSAALATHKCTTDPAKPYKCIACQRFFSTEFDLRNHQFSDHKTGLFACKVCNISIFEKSAIKRKVNSLRYQCYFCRKSFLSKLQLRKHIKHHNFVMSTQIRSGLQLN